MSKEPLLFLCHRIPFPPNKGDKIRSFNMLKALSEHFDIYLGTFVDDPYDWQYTKTLDDYCKETLILGQNKLLCKVKGLTAFVSGKAISLPYYASGKMQKWVDNTLAQQNISKVFIYSSVMAQFVNDNPELTRVVDFVDVDSDKWRQYAEGRTGLSRWVYQREYKTLQRFENETAERSHANLFVSPQEADLFKLQVDAQTAARTSGMLNGVDTAFFDPEADIEPLQEQVDAVFTGAMDYWANVDAVVWFCEHVWPRVRQNAPNATFYIVGGNPSSQVQALHNKHGVVVTGRVKDVRPYILTAKVVVAPLQIARGIQNKVLEAMSMAKPVVATTMAIEGINAQGPNIHVSDSAEQLAETVLAHLSKDVTATDNRQWIKDNLRWDATLARLPSLFEEG